MVVVLGPTLPQVVSPPPIPAPAKGPVLPAPPTALLFVSVKLLAVKLAVCGPTRIALPQPAPTLRSWLPSPVLPLPPRASLWLNVLLVITAVTPLFTCRAPPKPLPIRPGPDVPPVPLDP